MESPDEVICHLSIEILRQTIRHPSSTQTQTSHFRLHHVTASATLEQGPTTSFVHRRSRAPIEPALYSGSNRDGRLGPIAKGALAAGMPNARLETTLVHSGPLQKTVTTDCDHKRTALRQLRAPGVAIPAPVDANENHEAENACAKQNHHGGQREGWPKNPCCLLEHETTEIRVAAIKVARMAISCGNQ
ncbi:uncharacterized protein FFB20_14873 [Fusarium fujikuroi]|nr:uncharacterized protein FFB20_14873 [Fusarium fujikuroi]SCO20701.1 uncharacterized protein FFC1_13810 [Fusarium fujikuroi]SCO45506.1 uncharacterized protein FFNC_10330 [Fusarium fujikuroi]